jgi:hypothetical protein
VDIDHHKLGMDTGTVIGKIINLQDSGQLPHASMIVRSGHGIWLLWLIHDVESEDISQRAFPDKLEIYARIQAAIIERLSHLGADMAARDAARHLRVHSIPAQRLRSSGGFTVPTMQDTFIRSPNWRSFSKRFRRVGITANWSRITLQGGAGGMHSTPGGSRTSIPSVHCVVDSQKDAGTMSPRFTLGCCG